MNLKRNYISSASAQSLGRVCTMGANFIVFVIAARLLGTELFGQYSYITVFLGLAILVAEFGTTSVLGSDLPRVKGGDDSLYWGNYLILRCAITLVVMVVCIPVAWVTRPELFPPIFLGIFGLFFLGSRFFDPLFQVYDRPWYSFRGAALYAFLFAALTIPALYAGRTLWELILVYVLANLAYTIYAGALSLKLLKPRFRLDWELQRKIFSFAFPVGLSSIFTLVHTRADTFMLAYMKGDYAVGVYNGAYRFLDMAVIAAVMLSNPLVPIFSRIAIDQRSELREKYSRVVNGLGLLLIPCSLAVPLVSDQFVMLLFGSEYSEMAPLLDVMAWIGVLAFFSLFNFVVLLAVKVLRFQIWLGAVTAVFNVLLNLLLIPRFSFIGSAWATLLVECVFVAVSLLYIIKSIGNVIDWKAWFRIGAISLAILVMILFTGNLHSAIRLCLAAAIWLGGAALLDIPLFKRKQV